jgi:hypothetical protein
MKQYAFHGFVRLLCLMGVASVLAIAQNVDLGNQGKNVDFTKMPVTKPIKTGTVMPASCSVGDFFLKSDDSGGAGLYLCSETSVWSRVNVGSTTGSMIAGTGIAITGSQVSVEDAIVPLYFTGTQAPTIECNPGRDRYLDTVSKKIYVCSAMNEWSELAQVGRANVWAADQKQVFSPGTNNAGMNVGLAAQTPGMLTDGDMWYDATAARFRCRQDGVTVDCVPNGAQTTVARWNDEFTGPLFALGQLSSGLPWSVRDINAGCVTPEVQSEAKHPGTVNIATGGALSMGCQVVHGATLGWAYLSAASNWEYQWVFRAAPVTGGMYRVGFVDPTAAPPAGDGAWMNLDASAETPSITYEARSGGVSVTSPGPAPGDLTTTWFTLRIRSQQAGTWLMSVAQQGSVWSPEVTLCASSCTLASTLPAAGLSPFFEVQQTAATTPSASIVMDAWKGVMREIQ